MDLINIFHHLIKFLLTAALNLSAEKKIINAASKLAAMAKVLETPVAKKKLQRTQDVQGTNYLLFSVFYFYFYYY